MAEKVNTPEELWRRSRKRIELALPVRVHCRETLDHEWTEMSRLIDVTPFGARLRLSRPVEAGRLLHLTLPMPRPLRCFDHVEDQYRVWSLVRNVTLLEPGAAKGALVEIGVAFVGKRPPQSYETDPAQRYEVAQTTTESGLWTAKEQPGSERQESRHVMPIEVLVEVFGKEPGVSQSERTVTENISRQGAAVYTTLDLSPGRYVKVSSEQYGTSVLAVVRARTTGADGIARLHLEFVGGEWPL